MTIPARFSQLLQAFIKRDGRRVRQLAQATADRFGPLQATAHNTISRWLRGEVQRPRNWQEIVKLALVLGLDEEETNALLIAAGHKTVDQLRQRAGQEPERSWLSQWQVRVAQPPFQAPPRLVTFVGRQAEVNEIKRALRADNRLCCLYGMGGVGKTSLAIHLAYELRPHFPDGVLWLQLDRTDAMAALQGMAAAYGMDVSPYTDLGSRSSKVRELLALKQALLILDNAGSDDMLPPLLPPTGTCAAIITTRRLDLVTMDQANRLAVEPFHTGKKESLLLFTRILGRAGDSQEENVRERMAGLLGHLPLALDIAANRLRHEPGWTVADFLARLEEAQQRLLMLARGERDVRASFACSYDRLCSQDQQIFASLGAFAGVDFSPAAITGVMDLPLQMAEDSLRRLYNLSLVQSRRTGRYQLHPLLRDCSRELGDQVALTTQVAAYFVQTLLAQQADYDFLDVELSNVLAALQTAHEREMPALYHRAAEAFAEALVIAAEANLQREVARGRFGQAQLAVMRGNLAEARRLGQESLEIFSAIGHKRASEVNWWLAELPGEMGEL